MIKYHFGESRTRSSILLNAQHPRVIEQGLCVCRTHKKARKPSAPEDVADTVENMTDGPLGNIPRFSWKPSHHAEIQAQWDHSGFGVIPGLSRTRLQNLAVARAGHRQRSIFPTHGGLGTRPNLLKSEGPENQHTSSSSECTASRRSSSTGCSVLTRARSRPITSRHT